MKQVMFVSLLVITPFLSLDGQTKDFGMRNGYEWKMIATNVEQVFSKVEWSNKKDWIDIFTKSAKSYYILGIFDVTTRIPAQNYSKYVDSSGEGFYYESSHPYPYTWGVTIGQVIDGLDNIYKDFRNMNVLILDAIHIVQMETNGSSQVEIEWQTRYYRADEDARSQMSTERYHYDSKLHKTIDKLKNNN